MDDDDDDEDADSYDDSSRTDATEGSEKDEAGAQSPEVKRLREELDELRRFVSPVKEQQHADTDQFDAFRDFASGGVGKTQHVLGHTGPQRPLSAAAAPFDPYPTMPPPLPPAAPAGIPAHSPWLTVSKVNGQARTLLEALGMAEARRGYERIGRRSSGTW